MSNKKVSRRSRPSAVSWLISSLPPIATWLVSRSRPWLMAVRKEQPQPWALRAARVVRSRRGARRHRY
jgi:hypothetical protein